MLIDRARELFEGMTPDDMTHMDSISRYNSNYYSVNGHLLYADSDDDNFTQWYWVVNRQFHAVGGSYCSDDDRIIVDGAYT